MNDIKIFENEDFGKVRVVDVNGEPWFVGKDVAEILGYAEPTKAIRTHCRRVSKMDIGVQTGVRADGTPIKQTVEMSIIPEGDIYRLVARSKLPQSEKFEMWVFDEVLPSIRKTGGYMSEKIIVEKMVCNPQFLLEITSELKHQIERAEKAEKAVAILTHVNKTYTMTEIAKELNMKSAIALNKKLSDMGIQYKVNGTWVFYSKYSNLGYEEIKQEVLDSGRVVYHRKITQRGREFIIGAINKALEAVSL